jgi:FKBP-type peptidyl-prolyl cis-trans isomerase
MKRAQYLLLSVAVTAMAASCQNTEFKKAKSGMLYKIFPSKGKDSLAKTGNFVKLHFTQKLDDSVMVTTYGKMPNYIPVQDGQDYNPTEILSLLKKGDSAITVVLTDTLFKRGLMQEGTPPFKKGQRITISFKVLDVFRDEKLYQEDAQKEQAKDMPRQMKEREEQMAKMRDEIKKAKDKEDDEAFKSGEAGQQLQEMEAYLAGKKINAQKVGRGTYVVVKDPGTGKQATAGKYVKVKYTGRRLATDSVFQSNEYAFQLGRDEAIRGWDEGLTAFKQGGKGTLYIPGFRAYGKNPQQGSPFKVNDPLIFDVEMLQISDKPIEQAPMQQ